MLARGGWLVRRVAGHVGTGRPAGERSVPSIAPRSCGSGGARPRGSASGASAAARRRRRRSRTSSTRREEEAVGGGVPSSSSSWGRQEGARSLRDRSVISRSRWRPRTRRCDRRASLRLSHDTRGGVPQCHERAAAARLATERVTVVTVVGDERNNAETAGRGSREWFGVARKERSPPSPRRAERTEPESSRRTKREQQATHTLTVAAHGDARARSALRSALRTRTTRSAKRSTCGL